MTIAQKTFDRTLQDDAVRAPERAPDPPMSFQPGKRWYVVYTNVKCEFRAEKGLLAKGYDVFLPRAKRWIRHADKFWIDIVEDNPMVSFPMNDRR